MNAIREFAAAGGAVIAPIVAAVLAAAIAKLVGTSPVLPIGGMILGVAGGLWSMAHLLEPTHRRVYLLIYGLVAVGYSFLCALAASCVLLHDCL